MTLEELIDMLCCPETRQDLRLADAAEIEQLNGAIRGKSLCDLSGEAVLDPADAALLRADGEVAYLVRQGIPVMMGEKAVRWADVADDSKYLPARDAEEEGAPSGVTRVATDATADTTEAESLPERH